MSKIKTKALLYIRVPMNKHRRIDGIRKERFCKDPRICNSYKNHSDEERDNYMVSKYLSAKRLLITY